MVTDVPGDLPQLAEGTVIRSWLLDLLDRRARRGPGAGRAQAATPQDSGEGRWTVAGGGRPRGAAAGHHRGAVRPVRLPAGRLARDEGRRGAAQPVRRARRRAARRAPTRRAPTSPGADVDTASTEARGVPRSAWPDLTTGCAQTLRGLVTGAAEPTLVGARRPPVAAGLPVLRVRGARPGAGVTAFVGPNGQGKTNLVEAIGYVATHGSHRVATDAPLVRHGRGAGDRAGRGGPRRPQGADRARDQPGQGQPGAAEPLARRPAARDPRRAAHGAVRPRGPVAGQGRPGRAAPVPGRAADRADAPVRRRAGRLRPGAQAAQRPARRSAGRAAAAARPAGRRPVHPGRLGRPPGHARRGTARGPAGAGGGAAPAGGQAYADLAPDVGGRRPGLPDVRPRRTPSWSTDRGQLAAEPAAQAAMPRLRAAAAELERGDQPGRPAPGRAGAAARRAAGARLRQPRRVVVVRAGAAAGRLRRCCAPTASTRC